MKKNQILIVVLLLAVSIAIGVTACSKDSKELVPNFSAKISDQDVVGELDGNNNWVVTASLPELFKTFEDLNAAKGLNVTFVRAEIRNSKPGNPTPRYGIYLFDKDAKNIAVASVKIEGRRAILLLGNSITCTSPDPCSQTDGCTPTEIDGPNGSCVWSCSPCGGTCTKSVTH